MDLLRARFSILALVFATGCGRCGYEVPGANNDSTPGGEDGSDNDGGPLDDSGGVDEDGSSTGDMGGRDARPDAGSVDVTPLVFRPIPSANVALGPREDLVVTSTRAPGAVYVFNDVAASTSTASAGAVVSGTSTCAITGPGLLAEATGDDATDVLITVFCAPTSTMTPSGYQIAVLPGPVTPGTSTIDDYAQRILLDPNRGPPQALAVTNVVGGGARDLVVCFPHAASEAGVVVISSDVANLNGPLVETAVLQGEAAGDGFGFNLESVPEDVTGDGSPDLAINAASRNPGPNTGAVYVFDTPIPPGMQDPGQLAVTKFLPDGVAMQYGAGIGIVDLNADAQFDLVFASDGVTRSAAALSGAVYIFAGPIPTGMVMRQDGDYFVTGARTRDGLGSSISVDGNIVRTNRHDLLVQGCCATMNNVMRAGVLLGIASRATLNMFNSTDVSELRVSGAVSHDAFSKAVIVGDVNNDGTDDFAIGDPLFNGGSGRVYVYFGARDFAPRNDDEADVILEPAFGSGLRFGFEILER